MMSYPAPISIPVYKRLGHLKRCIDSLIANKLACKTTLYIYSDAAIVGDEEDVNNLRRYVRSICGFYKIIIIEQIENKRLGNLLAAIEEPMSKHSRVIYLEEDIVVSEAFLEYMNGALSFYENNPKVFSITGFTQPPCVVTGSTELGASTIFSAWSCGLWKKKYDSYKAFISRGMPHERLSKSTLITFKMIISCGFQQYFYTYRLSRSYMLTPDWSIGFFLWMNELLQVYPPRSFASQIGLDGSGLHRAVDYRFHNKMAKVVEVDFIDDFDIYQLRLAANKIQRFHGFGLVNDINFIIKIVAKLALGRRVL